MNSKVQVLKSHQAALSAQQLAQFSQQQTLEMDQQSFRNGMSNLGAAVNVITTQGIAGQAGLQLRLYVA